MKKLRPFRFMLPGFLAVTIMSACSNTGLPNFNNIDSLRILALPLDQPEISANAPGGIPATVTMKPFVSDVGGGGRTLTYQLEGCTDPGVAYGATPSCAGATDYQLIVSTTTITTLASPSYTGSANSIAITPPSATGVFQNGTPVALAAGGTTTSAQFNGVNYLLVYTLTATSSGGTKTTVQGFKRLLYSTKTTVNTNPTLSDLTVNSATWNSVTPGGGRVTVNPTLSTAETYSVMGSDGSTSTSTETFTLTWFITDSSGSFDFTRSTGTGGMGFTPPTAKPSLLQVVVVARDSRGGESVVARAF